MVSGGGEIGSGGGKVSTKAVPGNINDLSEGAQKQQVGRSRVDCGQIHTEHLNHKKTAELYLTAYADFRGGQTWGSGGDKGNGGKNNRGLRRGKGMVVFCSTGKKNSTGLTSCEKGWDCPRGNSKTSEKQVPWRFCPKITGQESTTKRGGV